MPAFPELSQGQDSSLYEVSHEDPAIRTEMDGGYVISRPRHTRTPRKTFKTGYTHIDQTDRALIEAFWNTVKGGSVVFDWEDPVSLATLSVRFKEELAFKYVGIGNVHHWDVKMTLEQA